MKIMNACGLLLTKKRLLSAAFFFLYSFAYAQNVLEVKNISQPNDIYTSANGEGAMIVRCHESIPLVVRLSNKMGKKEMLLIPNRVNYEDEDCIYFFEIPTEQNPEQFLITISSINYEPILFLMDISPKQLISLKVFDPNGIVNVGCYRKYCNMGMKEFANANYKEALNLFIVARDCNDANQNENEANIAVVETMIEYRAEGDEEFKRGNYEKALKLYNKVYNINPQDDYAKNRAEICADKLGLNIDTLYAKAEYFFHNNEWAKAKEYYNKWAKTNEYLTWGVIKNINQIENVRDHIEYINYIEKKEELRKNKAQFHSRVVTYEYRKDCLVGFSYGIYNMNKKAGGFFQMDFSGKVFDAIRSACRYGDDKFPELNIAFGWTQKIANPIWINFGPGFTGKMYYGSYLKDKYPKIGYGETNLLDTKEMGEDLSLNGDMIPSDYEDGWMNPNYAFALSPVVGITVKYSYFAFRLNYQYRWAIKNGLHEFVGNSRLSIGIGVAY